MANGKAAGPDAICAETLKYCGDAFLERLAEAFTRLAKTGGENSQGNGAPLMWWPFTKATAMKWTRGNFRSILLLDQAGKTLSRLLID